MSEEFEYLRASDADRERVVGWLNDAFAEGRLDVNELEERIDAAYSAKTLGDLRPITHDLPEGRTAPAPARVSESEVDADREPTVFRPRRWDVAAWLSASLLNVLIWGVICLTSGQWVYPWWVWVAGPWGVLLLTGRGWISGCGGYRWDRRHGRLYQVPGRLRGTMDTRRRHTLP